MEVRRPAWPIRRVSRWASPCWTITATAGRICSSPTTPSQTNCTATIATARLPKRAWPRAWPSARMAWRAGRWAWTPPITTAPDGRTCWWATSPIRCWGCINEGTGLFVDEAPSSTVGRASLLTLTFGAFFFDYDLDGYPDIFAANGHIEEEIGRVQPKVQYKEPPLLFHNLGKRQFENVTARMGAAFN